MRCTIMFRFLAWSRPLPSPPATGATVESRPDLCCQKTERSPFVLHCTPMSDDWKRKDAGGGGGRNSLGVRLRTPRFNSMHPESNCATKKNPALWHQSFSHVYWVNPAPPTPPMFKLIPGHIWGTSFLISILTVPALLWSVLSLRWMGREPLALLAGRTSLSTCDPRARGDQKAINFVR